MHRACYLVFFFFWGELSCILVCVVPDSMGSPNFVSFRMGLFLASRQITWPISEVESASSTKKDENYWNWRDMGQQKIFLVVLRMNHRPTFRSGGRWIGRDKCNSLKRILIILHFSCIASWLFANDNLPMLFYKIFRLHFEFSVDFLYCYLFFWLCIKKVC